MLKKNLGFKIGIMCALVVGMAQATTITKNLSTTSTSQGNTVWQDIQGVSYSYNDLDGNGQISVGETVTFSVTMEKTLWGTHDYDALKFWIDQEGTSGSTNEYTGTAIWNFTESNDNYSGATKNFTFSYTFETEGTYDITQSVMCSRDLSGLYYVVGYGNQWNDAPTSWDWDAWTEDIHSNGTKGAGGSNLQGETERGSITVVSKSVPEPGTFSLLACGLMSLAGAAFFRRKKK
jgi:hypothetical protein